MLKHISQLSLGGYSRTRLAEYLCQTLGWRGPSGQLQLLDARKRLRRRLQILTADFFARPTANIPQACGSWAKAKAAYRFFKNPTVSQAFILEGHREETAARVAEQPVVPLWAVYAVEAGTEPNPKEKLEWMLLTTLEVQSVEDAFQVIDYYKQRWGIERFHKVLKSGCRIEDRQLEQAQSLEACLAIDAMVAWRIYYACHLAREVPDAPCTLFFLRRKNGRQRRRLPSDSASQPHDAQ